jgi:DNA-binding GntR family transcriptional regulator
MMAVKPRKQAIVRSTKPLQTAAPAAREPAAVTIAKRIEEDIVLGRRQPRERLVEQDLCDLFETHRGDVRLALFELEKKGLVERIPNRGAMVRGLTPLEVREIYAVREELEVMAVRIIPFPVAPENIERLETLQRQHTAAVTSGDLLTMFHSNLSFHRVLYGLCGNACLIETIDLLAQRSTASAPTPTHFPNRSIAPAATIWI